MPFSQSWKYSRAHFQLVHSGLPGVMLASEQCSEKIMKYHMIAKSSISDPGKHPEELVYIYSRPVSIMNRRQAKFQPMGGLGDEEETLGMGWGVPQSAPLCHCRQVSTKLESKITGSLS